MVDGPDKVWDEGILSAFGSIGAGGTNSNNGVVGIGEKPETGLLTGTSGDVASWPYSSFQLSNSPRIFTFSSSSKLALLSAPPILSCCGITPGHHGYNAVNA